MWWIEDKYTGAGEHFDGTFQEAYSLVKSRIKRWTDGFAIYRKSDNLKVAEVTFSVTWVQRDFRSLVGK